MRPIDVCPNCSPAGAVARSPCQSQAEVQRHQAFAARHRLVLIDVDLLGLWNSGTSLTTLLDLDIGRSGTNRKLSPGN